MLAAPRLNSSSAKPELEVKVLCGFLLKMAVSRDMIRKSAMMQASNRCCLATARLMPMPDLMEIPIHTPESRLWSPTAHRMSFSSQDLSVYPIYLADHLLVLTM
jgi:hypothetical protein